MGPPKRLFFVRREPREGHEETVAMCLGLFGLSSWKQPGMKEPG